MKENIAFKINARTKNTSTSYLKVKIDINSMLKYDFAWLMVKESDILESIREQMNGGKEISEKQKQTVYSIKNKITKRKEPLIFTGGSPGSRKR